MTARAAGPGGDSPGPPLREATAADVAALAALHAAAFPPAQRWGAEALGLMLGMPGAFGVMAGAARDALGLVLVRVAGDEAEILTLAVRPAARRRGLARDLMGAAMDLARIRGAAAMFLEVGEANAPARALYAALGFVPVGRRRRYYADGSDALVLRRGLD